MFTLRDLGVAKLYRQLKRAWNGSILDDPERWGFESFRARILVDESKPRVKRPCTGVTGFGATPD